MLQISGEKEHADESKLSTQVNIESVYKPEMQIKETKDPYRKEAAMKFVQDPEKVL